jgi:hypothetical protein
VEWDYFIFDRGKEFCRVFKDLKTVIMFSVLRILGILSVVPWMKERKALEFLFEELEGWVLGWLA